MRHVENAAHRVGQRVHAADRRVGEGLAGQHGAQQHVRTGLDVVAVTAGGQQIGAQQLQRQHGQVIRQGILQALAGVGLNGMHHRVHSGGGGGGGRQADCQFRIQIGGVRIQLWSHDAALGGFARGDNGDWRYFRTRSGGGRHLDQRQAATLDLVDAVHSLQRLRAMAQHGHQLGHVHGRAPKPMTSRAPKSRARARAGLHDRLRRIGDHIIDDQGLPAGGGQAFQRGPQRAAVVQEGIGDHHRAFAGVALAQQGPRRRARPGSMCRWGTVWKEKADMVQDSSLMMAWAVSSSEARVVMARLCMRRCASRSVMPSLAISSVLAVASLLTAA